MCNIVEKQHAFVVDKMSRGLQIDIPQCKSTGGRATIIRDGKVVVLGRFYDPPPVATDTPPVATNTPPVGEVDTDTQGAVKQEA